MARHLINADGSWRYTGAIDKFPVVEGDVWAVDTRAGQHFFVCGDLEGGTPLFDVLKGNRPHLMYVDPPYNSGVARSYRTKAGVDVRAVDIVELWSAALGPAAQYRILAYVETGVAQREALRRLGVEMGAVVSGDWDITYYRKKPAALLAIDFRLDPDEGHPDFAGMDDEHTPLAALKYHQTGRVLDPCAGRGLTARAAFEAGWESVSHELSPFRLAEALKQFSLISGATPYRKAHSERINH